MGHACVDIEDKFNKYFQNIKNVYAKNKNKKKSVG